MALWFVVEKINRHVLLARSIILLSACWASLRESMGIFKDHQFEFSIKRTERSVPFNDILKIRYKRLVFLVKMGIPVILFEICFSL